jgi:hypothetical protein
MLSSQVPAFTDADVGILSMAEVEAATCESLSSTAIGISVIKI